MSKKQSKRKRSALVNSEEEEEEIQNKLETEEHLMENNALDELKNDGLVEELEQQDNPKHNTDNQSSSYSIPHLTEFSDSFTDENKLDSSTQPKRARYLPHSDAIFDTFLVPFDITPYLPSTLSPSSSSSIDNHLSSTGSTDSSNSVTSDRDIPESDNSSDDNLTSERLSPTEVHEVIDLSSPVIPRGSSDVVDLTMEPNSPTRSNFVDLTSEAVEQIDAGPIIVSVNKIYQRRSVIQARPSCRFEVTPSCSSNQENCTEEITDENDMHDDGDISIENVTNESEVNSSNNESTSHGESNKNVEKEQFHKSITCPICLDDAHLIKRKRQLSSTTCGHVFCDKCIKNAVKTQNKCPTCRKKLTLRQIHPLFL